MTAFGLTSRKSAIAASLLAMTALGYGSLGHAQALTPAPNCSVPADVAPGGYLKLPKMTVKITNNSTKSLLFPILSTGATKPASFWLQAGFCVPAEYLKTRTYTNTNVYRLYINPTTGIAPGATVTLSLPLWSQIAPGPIGAPSGDEPDQYINWWQGGRVSMTLYKKAITGSLAKDKAANEKSRFAGPVKGSPIVTCDSCEPLVVYEAAGALPENEPGQLTEYTLAGTDVSKSPIAIDARVVGYNISYVDSATLPVAMEPSGNSFVGWIGSNMTTTAFQRKLDAFHTSIYEGWPYLLSSGDDPQKLVNKVPSPTANFFANYSGDNPPATLTPPGASFKAMVSNWEYCVAHPENTGKVCATIREVDKLFVANYNSYVKRWQANWGCPGTPRALTSKNGEYWYLSKVYGWVPFNETPPGDKEQCKKPISNELRDTIGYTEATVGAVQKKYIALEYMTTTDGVAKGYAFNPYVQLIHGSAPPNEFLNLKNAYAFSIDTNGVGFLIYPGTGIEFAVGGSQHLSNPNAFDPGTIVELGLGYGGPGKTRFDYYGVCQPIGPDKQPVDVCPLMTDTSAYTGVKVPSVRYTDGDGTMISLHDTKGKTYKFIITKAPPFSSTDGKHPTQDMITCVPSDPNLSWCQGIHGYTIPVGDLLNPGEHPLNYVSTPPPVG